MTEQNKAPPRARKAAPAKTPAGRSTHKNPPAKRRTAKAAAAKNSEVKSVAVKNAEPKTPETKPESSAPKPAEAARTAPTKAADVLMETVEAVKAAAVRAAEAAPAPAPTRPVAEAAPARTAEVPSPAQMVAPAARLLEAGTEQARAAYARAQSTTEQFRHAVTETAAASTRGALEVNGKVINAMRAQSDAAMELWRSTLTASSFAEAVRAQTSGTRQLYETAATHWRDVAETTTRWISASVMPMQSAWTDRGR